jgi:cytochrome c-type biogenesis protein
MIISSACISIGEDGGGISSQVVPDRDGLGIDQESLSIIRHEENSQTKVANFSIRFYQTGNLKYGETTTLYSILSLGKPIVLNFWAGLCPPCRIEMNDMDKVYGVFNDQVILIGVDIGQFVLLGTEEDGKRLLSELGISYPAGTTMDSGIAEAYGIFGMPTTIFIRPDGTIHKRWTGALNESKLAELIVDLIEAS